MELGVMDKADYSNDFNDNFLSLIMSNHSFSSTNFDKDTSIATLHDNYSIDDWLSFLIDDDNEDESLLKDLDPQWTEKVPNTGTNSHNNSVQRNKSLFDTDEDEDNDVDLNGWMYKPKIEWEKTDTINWLLWAGLELGHSYSQLSPQLAIPGKDLLCLLREDFRNCDQHFGEKLYDLLHQERDFTSYRPSCDSSRSILDGETLDEICDDFSGEELANCGSDSTKQRRPNNKRPRLWKFIRHLLLDPKFCPGWIRWEDYENKTFRFVRNESVAKLWGQLNNNPNMTYKKFTRAIRHYYKNPDKEGGAVFVPVQERLVYKFGDKVKGLESDNPNFDPKYCRRKSMENLTIED